MTRPAFVYSRITIRQAILAIVLGFGLLMAGYFVRSWRYAVFGIAFVLAPFVAYLMQRRDDNEARRERESIGTPPDTEVHVIRVALSETERRELEPLGNELRLRNVLSTLIPLLVPDRLFDYRREVAMTPDERLAILARVCHALEDTVPKSEPLPASYRERVTGEHASSVIAVVFATTSTHTSTKFAGAADARELMEALARSEIVGTHRITVLRAPADHIFRSENLIHEWGLEELA